MLVMMKRETFDLLEDVALQEACIEPTLKQLHGIHMNPAARSQVYAQLTSGQLALFMFRVLYDRVGDSAADLYCRVSHLLTESRKWAGIKGGLRYFGDDAMLQLLEEMESLLEARNRQGGQEEIEWRGATPWDLNDDAELLIAMSQFNATFHEIAPATLRRMGTYIRNHPNEFVQFEN